MRPRLVGRTWRLRKPRRAAPIDERSPHARRFRTNAIEGVVRDERNMIRLVTEKLGRESERPDAASSAFTAAPVSPGQTAPTILSADNKSVHFQTWY
jgi:hypothetical protein